MIPPNLGYELFSRVIASIRATQTRISWKPGKDLQHLHTRLHYGHLPISATLDDYEAIITGILCDDGAEVYAYVWHSEVIYPTVVGRRENRVWLVMFDLDGVMETAFPPVDPDLYLSDSRFLYLGKLKELVP